MELQKKDVYKISCLYGIIIGILNFIGAMMPSSGNVPVFNADFMTGWVAFMDEHKFLINFSTVLTFVLPVILFFVYSFIKNLDDKKISRFINLPVAYSFIGVTGWIFSFCIELGCLLWVRKAYGINIYPILVSSFLYISQEALFIFTLGFLFLDAIHRKLVLPRYFPLGNLRQYKGKGNPSIGSMFVFLYISIGFFPLFYMTSTLVTTKFNYKIPIPVSVFVVLAIIVVFGIIIMISFASYFTSPMEKLKAGTERVKEGDYTHKINVVSNDAFGELADTFNDMIDSLDTKTRRLQESQDSFIRGMAVMVESRDNSTGGHINRTSDCVRVFVNKLKETEEYKDLDEQFCRRVIKAAPMHDLGKIAVDDAILRKPGKFEPEEYEKMKQHSAEGARIVETVLSNNDDQEFKNIAVNVAHYHHEKWDGSGYPEKISGTQIPLEARIMALADVFDALVSKRCYKVSFTYDRAFQIIEESLGSHFDPELGKIFISCRPSLEELYQSY